MKSFFRNNRLTMITLSLILLVIVSFKTSIKEIPKTWDVEALEESHLPPPVPGIKVKYAPESYYNSLPELVIYKTYPVYGKGFEPPGYLDSLKKLEPQIVFDVNKIKTEEDWIKAGESVFFWPAAIAEEGGPFGNHLDSEYFAGSGDPIAKDGIYPFAKYIITEKGKVLYGDLSCATCHSRVQDNGEVIIGAQGNHAFDRGFGYLVKRFNLPRDEVNKGVYQLAGTPWVDHKEAIMSKTQEEIIASLMACPIGVMSRQGMAFDLPIRVPSLIGIRDIKYLDHTGLMLHREPADLMRYAALNQGMDMFTSYKGFIPLGIDNFSKLPDVNKWNNPFGYESYRYSDAQLYALTKFIYSLRPPKNPNKFPGELRKKGEKIFIEQGCVTCHTPPLYTNNMLTPVDGFEPPKEHYELYEIFNVSVETDPSSTLKSRRGTGYYKIPSLRGMWYHGPFFHNGELATLDDVFDPARLRDDYVPTGYKPAGVKTKAVKGHDFGLELSAQDKKALIAFLKSL
jgi:hypothetical protein